MASRLRRSRFDELPPRGGVRAERRRRATSRRRKGSRLLAGGDRTDTDVFPPEQRQPVCQGPPTEDRLELAAKRRLVRLVLPFCKLRPPEQLAEAREEPRLERPDGQPPAVRAVVDRVAGEAVR